MRIHQNFFRAFAIAGLSLSILTAQSATSSGQATSSSGEMVGKTDMTFMTKAAQGGMMEVHLAQMAQQKAASEDAISVTIFFETQDLQTEGG